MKKLFLAKRIKNYLKIFIVFIFIFIGWNCVKAESLTYDKIEDIYSYVERDGETRLFYLKIYKFNGKPAYCIELGEDIVDVEYSSTTDYKSMGYSKKQIDYINLISYYGYEYPGHNDYRYYMAAQELIWEYLEGIDIYWTNELNKDNPSKINIDKYLNEIKGLVSKHNVLPSIDGMYYDYYVGKDILISDNNKRLSDYEIIEDSELGAYIDGNKIVIPNKGDRIGKYKIKLRQKVSSSKSGLIYYNDTSQTLYSMRGITPNVVEFDIEIKGASFVLNKYDSVTLTNIPSENGSLSGAEYELYDSDNQLVSVLTTDENGQAYVDGLTFGIYTIQEITSSYGYKLDEKVYELVIDKVSNELIVYEEPDLKKIEIYKTYGDDFVPEENVSFDVKNSDGELYSTIVTDKNGYGSTIVPYGGYIISQKNTIDGYLKIDDFQVNIDENSDDVLTYTLNDEKIEEIEEPKVEQILVKNPKTYDKVMKHFIFFCLSGILLIVFFGYIIMNFIKNLVCKRNIIMQN